MLNVITTCSSELNLSLYLDILFADSSKKSKEDKIKTVFIGEGKSKFLFHVNKPLEGKRIFIQNAECGLHPRQQRELIFKLLNVKNSEIMLTTYSPIIISECPSENVNVLFLEDGKIKQFKPKVTLGLSVNEVLDNILGNGKESLSISEKINKIYTEISDLEDKDKFEDARLLLEDLRTKIGGSTIEIIRLEHMLHWLEN
mgnify:FL=1